jgi:competence protein ComEA
MAGWREQYNAWFSPMQGMIVMKYFFILMFSALLMGLAWAAEPVNVNTASAEEIAANLKGIGLSKAQLIVDYREANGSFLHVDELVKVKGIGLKTVDNNRGMILLGDELVSGEN